jgi:hypothetical protein
LLALGWVEAGTQEQGSEQFPLIASCIAGVEAGIKMMAQFFGENRKHWPVGGALKPAGVEIDGASGSGVGTTGRSHLLTAQQGDSGE